MCSGSGRTEKTQVSVLYEGNVPVSVTDVVVSTQDSEGVLRKRKGAALLAAMQSAALPENVIHSSCTKTGNPERRACSNLLYNRELICPARVAEWQTLRT
jgi:S-adenosylmethionine synthetase